MVRRVVPQYIGNVKIPENRETTHQLLRCWAELLDEVASIEPLLKNLKEKSVEGDFIKQASEIAMYLTECMGEKKLEPKANTDIYTGNPRTMIGYFNSRTAGVLHHYFDEPDVKLRKPAYPARDV